MFQILYYLYLLYTILSKVVLSEFRAFEIPYSYLRKTYKFFFRDTKMYNYFSLNMKKNAIKYKKITKIVFIYI